MIRNTAIFLALLTLAAPMKAAERKPNFLFILTDDQRWDAVGVVQREQGVRARFPWFETPGMDRLAEEGIRFRNAFVTLSICAPSRAAFLTGRYNHLNGVIYNSTHLPEDSVTHATELTANGYQTAYIGKWHMGNQRGQRPGFTYSASFIGQGDFIDCFFEINGVPTPTKGWVDDVSTDFAIEWMKEKRDVPFSMVVGYKSPHSPRGGKNLPERLRHIYEGETSREVPNSRIKAIYHRDNGKPEGELGGLSANSVHLDYLRHVKGVDENVERLLDTLDELGIAEDTVVVYTSDNGYFLGEHGLGDKRALYEESLRIPMLVRYPRLFGKGKVVDEMVLNIDLAPTFLDLADVAVPEQMQGKSWKELAAGRKPEDWRTSFLALYFKELGDTPTCVGVRTVDSKLVKYTEHPEFTEVFSLSDDPYELNNLAAEEAAAVELEKELALQIKETKYQVPPNAAKRK